MEQLSKVDTHRISYLNIVFVNIFGDIKILNVLKKSDIEKYFSREGLVVSTDILNSIAPSEKNIKIFEKKTYKIPWSEGGYISFPDVHVMENDLYVKCGYYSQNISEKFFAPIFKKCILRNMSASMQFYLIDESMMKLKTKNSSCSGAASQFLKLASSFLIDMGVDVINYGESLGESQFFIKIGTGKTNDPLELFINFFLVKLVFAQSTSATRVYHSFAPKLFSEDFGSGMKLSFTVFEDKSSGSKITSDYVCGKICGHIKDFLCFTNPISNSYKRFDDDNFGFKNSVGDKNSCLSLDSNPMSSEYNNISMNFVDCVSNIFLVFAYIGYAVENKENKIFCDTLPNLDRDDFVVGYRNLLNGYEKSGLFLIIDNFHFSERNKFRTFVSDQERLDLIGRY